MTVPHTGEVRRAVCGTILRVLLVASVVLIAANRAATLAGSRDPGIFLLQFRIPVLVAAFAAAYARWLAEAYARRAFPEDRPSRAWIEAFVRAVPLHDVGTLGLEIDAELATGRGMASRDSPDRTHVVVGHEIVSHAVRRVGHDVLAPTVAAGLVRHHHERFDATGYPDGLAGAEIPLEARMMAVLDAYFAADGGTRDLDAHERAVGEVVQGRGTTFDPRVVDAFLEIERRAASLDGGREAFLDAVQRPDRPNLRR